MASEGRDEVSLALMVPMRDEAVSYHAVHP
jgi:hypothetical protein